MFDLELRIAQYLFLDSIVCGLFGKTFMVLDYFIFFGNFSILEISLKFSTVSQFGNLPINVTHA